MQNHASRGGGDDLGDRGEVVNSGGVYGRRLCIVSKTPETQVGDQVSAMSDGDGCARKSALADAGEKNIKRPPELHSLMVKHRGQRAVGTLVQKIPSCCFCFWFITHSVHR